MPSWSNDCERFGEDRYMTLFVNDTECRVPVAQCLCSEMHQLSSSPGFIGIGLILGANFFCKFKKCQSNYYSKHYPRKRTNGYLSTKRETALLLVCGWRCEDQIWSRCARWPIVDVELPKAFSFEHLRLPWYRNTARIEFTIKRRVRLVDVDSLDSRKLLNVEYILRVHGVRL